MATIVIRSLTKERISCTCCYEWSRHDAWRDGHGILHLKSKLITRKKALELIERLGLVESHRRKFGEIYDTPNEDFKALFPDGIKSKMDFDTIERTDNI